MHPPVYTPSTASLSGTALKPLVSQSGSTTSVHRPVPYTYVHAEHALLLSHACAHACHDAAAATTVWLAAPQLPVYPHTTV